MNSSEHNPILEYIEAQDEKVKGILYRLREIILEEAPDLTERIAYGMPTFKGKRNIIHFAAQKAHIGIYPGPAAIEHFHERLSPYKCSKGTIQIPYGIPIDEELIRDLVCYNRENE